MARLKSCPDTCLACGCGVETAQHLFLLRMMFSRLYHEPCKAQAQAALSTHFSQLRGWLINRPDQTHFVVPYL